MRQTFSVRFLARKRVATMEFPQTIYARISLNGERVEFATSLKCNICSWNRKAQKAQGGSKETLSINGIIGNIRARINEIYYHQTLHGEATSAQEIKDIFTGATKKKHYLISLFLLENTVKMTL